MKPDPLLRTNTAALSARCISEYAGEILSIARLVNSSELERFMNFIRDAQSSGNTMFIGGNGGSNSIAAHSTCDLLKGGAALGHPINAIALGQNGALSTALANDYGYETALVKELEAVSRQGDYFLIFSSSGTSKNVVRALEYGVKHNLNCFLVNGFESFSMVEVPSLFIPSSSYFVVEDISMMLVHLYVSRIQANHNNSVLR